MSASSAPRSITRRSADRETFRLASDITKDRVALEYAKIAFFDLRYAINWGTTVKTVIGRGKDKVVTTTNGMQLIASAKLDPDITAAISEVWEDKDGKIKFRTHSKIAALEGLCRLLGFNAPTELTGAGGGPIELADVTDLEVTRRIAFALQSALQQTIDEDGAPV